jgi:hypothetical protein
VLAEAAAQPTLRACPCLAVTARAKARAEWISAARNDSFSANLEGLRHTIGPEAISSTVDEIRSERERIVT